MNRGLIIAALAAFSGCGAEPEGFDNAEIAITIDPTASYTIVGVQSSKCVQIRGASGSDLAVAEIGSCNGSTSQQFRFEDMGSGYYRARNVNSGKCLDVEAASTAAGARIIQFTCGTGTHQQWRPADVAGGAVQLVARHSGRVMDVYGAGTAEGTAVIQWTSSSSANQQFRLTSAGVGTCTARSTTYEAETMTHTTGGAVSGGWNVWSNGSISTTHTFAAGPASIKVVAQGTPAQGVWPHFVVSVAGTAIGNASATTSGWATYSFPFTATAGAKEVRVTFDNDFNASGEDRNLIVDRVVVDECTGGGGTGGTGGTGGGGSGGTTGGSAGNGGGTGGCSSTTTPVARHGQLRVEGGKLLNQCGRQVQFASMSMYDWSQQGRQFYNATAVRNLAGTGTGQKKCTTLRIPLLASNWPSQYPRIKTVMDACIANGIYCIPNWHVIGASNVANAKAFYVQLARDYGHTPNILYEPWNEPTTQSWSQIKAYMEEIMDAVRPIDSDGIFLAGTRQWCQRPDEACANPITRPNVGYVFHFYANSHSLSSFRGNIDRCLNARQLVWTTEYGGVSANGDGTFNVTEVNRWWDYMDQNLISSNNWAIETNSETSSVFTTNASATGPWPDSQITFSGRNVFAYIAERYPVTMSQ